MQINIREDAVEIEGYVNAVERNSKPLLSRMGKFIERIKKGAFARALKRNDDVHVLLNHDWQRDLGSTKKGNLELTEDNIGLRAKCTISDKEVMEMAKRGDLVGWSFGFYDRDVKNGVENGMLTREVNDLDLQEVSILDRSKVPAYDGTLIMARSEDSENSMFVSDSFDADDDEHNVSRETREDKPDDVSRETKQEIDYSKFKAMIAEMKED
jgi:HK97 family phage prohead protease